MYNKFLKRVIDIIVATICVVILSPLLLIVILLIKFDSKGPVFFTQERIGRCYKPFKILKLRTMTNKVHRNNHEIFLDSPEVTKVGYFLRKFKIDELPQLINVIKGDLSLIGPRPLMKETIEELTEKESKRMQVRPGLSGLAQVNGNIYLNRKERLNYDVYYVEHLTFKLDIIILLKTVLVIIKGEEKFVRSNG